MIGNIGMGELVLIAGLALIIMGPEKFPEFAKIALRAFRDLRGYVDDIKREMAQELKPVKRELQEMARHNPEEYIEKLAKAVTSVDESDEDSEKDAESKEENAESSNPPQEISPEPQTPGAPAPSPQDD